MSIETAHDGHPRTAVYTPPVYQEGAHQELAHQFEDIDQQNESYIVGMWTFLATEILFFGALFLAYLIYRTRFPQVFIEASQELDVTAGFINTLILLTSSLSMAFAVQAAQLGRRKAVMQRLTFTVSCAFAFLVVKYFEYSSKFEHHLVPGPNFQFHGVPVQGPAELFFSIYFAMTGLHGIHVVIGIGLMVYFGFLYLIRSKAVEDYMPIEMVGLYWHFVDIVWIFLYPLLYLIEPKV